MATLKFSDELKLNSMCRTCLATKDNLHYMFDAFIDALTLSYMITSVTGIAIKFGDGLPTSVCSECKEKATIAYDFKKKSEKSDEVLHDIISKCDPDIDSQYDISSEFDPAVKAEVELEENDDSFDNDFPFDNSLDNTLDDLADIKNEQETNTDVFQCKVCHTLFDSKVSFNDHISKCVKVEYNDEDSSTYCPLCGICFSDAHLLTKHMWSKHSALMGPKKRGRPKKLLTSAILNKLSENGYEVPPLAPDKRRKIHRISHRCGICNTQVRGSLTEHNQQHKDVKVFCCILCKIMFLKKSKFEQHSCFEDKLKKEEKNEKVNDDSEINNENFLTEVALASILNLRTNMDNINSLQVCSMCSALFLSIDELLMHTDNEHPDVSQRCNICMKVFASIATAARHRRLCKQIERKFKCSTCGLKFAYQVSLNKHILRHHEGQHVSVTFLDSKESPTDKKFPCSSCNRSFIRQDFLDRHRKTHAASARKYECDVCSKKFVRPDSLSTHILTHRPDHEGTLAPNTCLCLYCGRSFTNSSNLIVHMRRHTGQKPYKCDFCDKGFPRSSDLQCHRRSHTGERPCICSVCGKAFSRSNKLSRHMRVHTGLKPYKCTYCDKAFSQSNDLKLHIRRHTGDKPYVCEICGDRFIQGTALQNHRRAHGHFPSSTSAEHLTVQEMIESKTLQLPIHDDKKKPTHIS